MFRRVHVAHNIAYSSFSGRETRMSSRKHVVCATHARIEFDESKVRSACGSGRGGIEANVTGIDDVHGAAGLVRGAAAPPTRSRDRVWPWLPSHGGA
jgi:hypothetical protein